MIPPGLLRDYRRWPLLYEIAEMFSVGLTCFEVGVQWLH